MKKTLHKRLFSKFFNNRTSIGIVSCISIIAFIGLMWSTSFFSVKTIEFISDPSLPQVRGVDEFYHQNIFFVDTQALEKHIVANNAVVKEAHAEKIFPQRVVVRLNLYEPAAVLTASNGYFILAANGRILQKQIQTNASLPDITFYQKLIYETYAPGDIIDFEEIRAALHFLTTAKSIGLNVKHIDIDGLHMIRLQIDEKEVWFTTEKDQGVQDYQLVTLVKQFKIEGKDFVTLDLRFDKPVLTIKK